MMSKENALFSIIGVLLGFIVGFMFANNVNQRAVDTHAHTAAEQNAGQVASASSSTLPSNGVAGQQNMSMEQVQAAIAKAKDEPTDFNAQMEAAQLFSMIRRHDQALEYLTRANQIRPDNYDVTVALGNINFDAGRYETAESWYNKALAKRPDDVNVRTDLGLSFFMRQPPDADRAIAEYRRSLERDPRHEQTLQNLAAALVHKGDAGEAQALLDRLKAINPSNPALTTLRPELDKLRSAAQ